MRLRLVLGAVVAFAGVMLLDPSGALAQERTPTQRTGVRSELIDPFPPSRAGGARVVEMLVEIIDPFEGMPPSPEPRRSDLVDPFRLGLAIVTEILDPWAS